MAPVDVQRREARLIVLRFLAEEINRTLTSSAITIKMNEIFGMGRDRAWVEQELDYLSVMGAIALREAGTVKVARLLPHGARHLAHMLSIPDVQRSTDPFELPEALGA